MFLPRSFCSLSSSLLSRALLLSSDSASLLLVSPSLFLSPYLLLVFSPSSSPPLLLCSSPLAAHSFYVIFATSTVRHVHMGRWGHNVQVRPSWFEPHTRAAEAPKSPVLLLSSPSLLLPPFFLSLLPLLLAFFSPSPSLFSFSLLLLSSLPLPGKEKEKKKAPRRGGVWGGAPVLKRFPQKPRRKKKTFKRRDQGESQMK